MAALHDWRAGVTDEGPTAALKAALRSDRAYLLEWHALLAYATFRALYEKLEPEARWRAGHEAAQHVIDMLFSGQDRPDPVTDVELGLRPTESPQRPAHRLRITP